MYQVEGIGLVHLTLQPRRNYSRLSNRYDFIPDALDRGRVDVWMKTEDDEAWAATSALHRREGLLVGGSSGSALAGTLKYLKNGDGWTRFGNIEGKNVVVILPDGYVRTLPLWRPK
jgi:cysteine synthase